MRTLLLDASVWLAARDADDRFHRPAVEIVQDPGPSRRLAALDLTLYEVANVASVRWRSTAEAETLIELVLTSVADRLVRVDGPLARDSATLALGAGLTVYDAAYVACARSRDWTLVSGDVADLVGPGLARAPDEVLSTPDDLY